MAHEKRFQGTPQRLRDPERMRLMEVDRVTDLVLGGIDAKTALDVGTGSGIFAEAFVNRGLRVTGIDPNPAMVEASRALIPTAHFLEGAMESMPLPDKSADLVMMSHVLHETDDLVGSLKEARRCARLRVAALEWPYRQDAYRPPLEHRLKPETVIAGAREAGFTDIKMIQLETMVLFILH